MHFQVAMISTFPTLRLRRLRQHPALRDLVRETELNLKDLVLPLFIKENLKDKQPIVSMPGHFQIPLEYLDIEIEEILNLRLNSVMLFGIPAKKDEAGSSGCMDFGIIQEAIKKIKKNYPGVLIISDICLCEYTDHGHCGLLKGKNVDNDATLQLLIKQAVSHAQAGADVVAPSGMIDGMVKHIRVGLDEAGFQSVPILSYSVKYNSALYGPFRAAAEGAPSFGDRSSHQMDTANGKEALREVHLDVSEGADMLMVKPAHSYLDVIYQIKQHYPYIPLGAYHTSGEFAMIKAAGEKGWVEEKKVALEILRGIRRAGADFIITYYAKEVAKWYQSCQFGQSC